jgi:alkylated DNA repair dioxygenase AlkB
MFDLFNQTPDKVITLADIPQPRIYNDISAIVGLSYIPNFITKADEKNLLNAINAQAWLADIKRRVQHYGYKYDYKARSIDYSMYLGALPSWALPIANRLYDEKHIDVVPDQLIINEYIPGQGIANHIDCEPCFGETIISISLGSLCVMDFINPSSKQKIEIMLEPRSLVVINGDARHKWTHGISQRKTDVFNGTKFERSLRISLTFRKVILK